MLRFSGFRSYELPEIAVGVLFALRSNQSRLQFAPERRGPALPSVIGRTARLRVRPWFGRNGEVRESHLAEALNLTRATLHPANADGVDVPIYVAADLGVPTIALAVPRDAESLTEGRPGLLAGSRIAISLIRALSGCLGTARDAARTGLFRQTMLFEGHIRGRLSCASRDLGLDC